MGNKIFALDAEEKEAAKSDLVQYTNKINDIIFKLSRNDVVFDLSVREASSGIPQLRVITNKTETDEN